MQFTKATVEMSDRACGAAENLMVTHRDSRYRETQTGDRAGDRETGQTEDGVKTPEEMEDEIWQHALDLAEPGGLGQLVEADAVVQALIMAAGRLGEHTAMPPALFCSHVVEAVRRLIAERDEDAPRT
jgi:hypothetical protein